jgi:hypothetical protein
MRDLLRNNSRFPNAQDEHLLQLHGRRFIITITRGFSAMTMNEGLDEKQFQSCRCSGGTLFAIFHNMDTNSLSQLQEVFCDDNALRTFSETIPGLSVMTMKKE